MTFSHRFHRHGVSPMFECMDCGILGTSPTTLPPGPCLMRGPIDPTTLRKDGLDMPRGARSMRKGYQA